MQLNCNYIIYSYSYDYNYNYNYNSTALHYTAPHYTTITLRYTMLTTTIATTTTATYYNYESYKGNYHITTSTTSTTATTTIQLQLQLYTLHHATHHNIWHLWVRWPLQPFQNSTATFRSISGFALSLKTSATALCSTTGNYQRVWPIPAPPACQVSGNVSGEPSPSFLSHASTASSSSGRFLKAARAQHVDSNIHGSTIE